MEFYYADRNPSGQAWVSKSRFDMEFYYADRNPSGQAWVSKPRFGREGNGILYSLEYDTYWKFRKESTGSPSYFVKDLDDGVDQLERRIFVGSPIVQQYYRPVRL